MLMVSTGTEAWLGVFGQLRRRATSECRTERVAQCASEYVRRIFVANTPKRRGSDSLPTRLVRVEGRGTAGERLAAVRPADVEAVGPSKLPNQDAGANNGKSAGGSMNHLDWHAGSVSRG